MNREQLNQYKKNKKEIKVLTDAIDRLQARLNDVPVISTKVAKSSGEFPYNEQHVQITAAEPAESAELKDRIGKKKRRREKLIEDNKTIENFIKRIPEGVRKEIFELVFLDGMTQEEAGKSVGYTQSMVSKVIKEVLKHS